ncbi:MAG: rod shape-determining protein MreC [Tenacibaculum sp.]
MQQLVYFLQRYKYFLYFLFLELIAVSLIINNYSFHKSKFINSANLISGKLLHKASNIKEYLHLKKENKLLLQENTALKNKLEQFYMLADTVEMFSVLDTSVFKQKYRYINAKIIANNYRSPYNFLTINRGKNHKLDSEMAVVNNKGIVGITESVSAQYSRVQSILNKNSKTNARFKHSHHYGTLQWNGKNYNTVQLTDIPRQAIVKIGDTVITGGKSSIFPEGIPIGTIKSIPKKITASNTFDIQLFNDMTKIKNIYVIINFHKDEINTLTPKK